MHKKRLFVNIFILIVSFGLLTSCSGDHTAEVTADATPTANPLDSMDQVERGILLYEKFVDVEISSYKSGQDMKLLIQSSSEEMEINSTAQIIVYDNNGDNYAEYFVGETTAEGEKTTLKQGYIDGKAFYLLSDGAKMYSPCSKEDYMANSLLEVEALEAAIKISRDTCSDITSYKTADGSWVVKGEGYSVSSSMTIFREIFEEIAELYGYSVASCNVQVMLVVSEDGIPSRQYVKVETVPYPEYDLKLILTSDSTYTDINSVTEAPKVDLTGAVEVPDIDIVSKISNSVNERFDAESATAKINSLISIGGDLRYYYEETDNISYGVKNGVYNFDIDVVMKTNGSGVQEIESTGSIKYDGKNFMYDLSGVEESTPMDAEAAKSVIANLYIKVLPTEQNITGYTLMEKDGISHIWFKCNENACEEALASLNAMTGGSWTVQESEATYLVRMDGDGNVIFVKQDISLTARLATYQVTFGVINTLDFTK